MDVKRFGFDPSHGYFVQRPDGYYVMTADFDRVTAERDAIQLRLNAVEEENDRFRKRISELESSAEDADLQASADAARNEYCNDIENDHEQN